MDDSRRLGGCVVIVPDDDDVRQLETPFPGAARPAPRDRPA